MLATASWTLTPMYTVPGGVPSTDSSPTTPVVETATSAPSNPATPMAICSAASAVSTDSALTPNTFRFTAS